MKKKTRTARKVLSVFLSVLMILTTLTVAAPGFVLAAGSYYVRVYLNIYDGANSDGYGNPYTVVTDPSSEFYGKPDDYKWDYGSSWSATDNSKGYDGEVNMAGFTLFYDNDKKYKTYDLSADLVAATTTLGNNWTSMDDLTLENFASWPNKVEKVYEFELDSLPSSLFWINDENNAINGETSFGIYKITVAETSTGPEHTLWSGLSGSESYYECYYGTITPTGLITPWDDCPDAQTYTFYKDYTTSAVGTWIDPYNAGDYNVYPVNNYLSGGVSATFTVGNSGSQTNTDYVDVGNTNNYYINFTNHSTQEATITSLNNSSLANGFYNNIYLASGETKSFPIIKSSMSGDGGFYNFSFSYTLDNVYEKNGTTPASFYQAAYIGTWDTTGESSEIGLPEGESANNGFTIYNGNDMDLSHQFAADVGLFETVSTTGNRTSNPRFEYNYWLDNSAGYTKWQDIGLRINVKKYTYNFTIHLQKQDDSNCDGTLNITGDIANTGTASITMADLLTSWPGNINVPAAPPNRPWAYYNQSTRPFWGASSNQEWATITSNVTPAYFPFCGNIFEGSTTSTNPGKIVFDQMTWVSPSTWFGGTTRYADFGGTINVYVFNKAPLREYVRNLGGLGANWAPVKTRFNADKWSAYETALSDAMRVLANQKTNQKAVTDAYNNLYSATEALKATASLKSQISEVTYTKRTSDYDSAVTDTTSKYIIMPIGTETAVPAYDTYKYATSGNVVGKQSSNLKTNYTQYDTGINPIDYRYWKIDVTGVEEALQKATDLLNTPLDTYSDSYYEKLQDARTALSAFDRDADTWTPTHQSDIDNALAALNELLAHSEDNYDACIYDGDDEGDEADIVNEKFNCVEGGTIEHVCIICGKAKVVENVDPSEGGHTVDAWTPVDDTNHKGNCTACGEEVTASHIFTNPVLTRPTEADGVWSDGTYTYTCVCGQVKTEPAVRADYAELEEAVEALEELNKNENLTDDAKAEIAEALKKADDLADNLVKSEQDDIDKLVDELKDVKADVEDAISSVLGTSSVTEATSGIKVQFLAETGVDAIDSVQLGASGGFPTVRMRLTNGNKDLPITITRVTADNAFIGADNTAASAVYDTATALDKNGGSKDLYIVAPADFNTAGNITYTITYTVDGLKDADGNPIVFTTKAYLYVKAAAFTPYHLMDERAAWPRTATSKWQHYVEATNYGDFGLVSNISASKFNDNLESGTSWISLGYAHTTYDYDEDSCQAGCTDGNYTTGDGHVATYRYYVDTSLAPTWEAAGFRVRVTESAESIYENAPLKYMRVATDQAFLDGISGDDKTFTVTFVPSSTSNVPEKRWSVTSTGTLEVGAMSNSNEDEYLFGEHKNNDEFDETSAYANFTGTIPAGVTDAKFMFSPRIEFNGAYSAESVTMTSHIWLTSYDKAELRKAVANAETAGYNPGYFDETKYEAYENALANAKEVLGKAETNQTEVDEATAALNAAIADLTKAESEAKFVLTVTHSIHENADKNSTATGTEYDYYLVNGTVTPALNADIIALETINKYDNAVELTINEDTAHTYNYWYIDYSKVQDAINAADAIINDTTTGYSDEYKGKVEAAKNALQNILDGKDATTTPESQKDVTDAIDAVTALTGHTCDEAVEIPAVAPTCKEAGLKAGAKCSVCGKITKAQEIDPKLPHTEEIIPAVPATCTATGLTEGKKCSACGEILVAQTETPMAAHTPGEVVVENNKAATCTAEGSYDNVTYCTKCGTQTSRETITVDKAAHSYGDGVVTAPTCTAGGYTTYTCTVCSHSYTDNETSAINHDYDIANAKLVARPELIDGEWTDGKYEATCRNDESHKLPLEGVKRADYSTFETAIEELKELAAYENFTDEVKNAILAYAEKLEKGEVIPLDYVDDYTYGDVTIKGEQDKVNAAVLELTKDGGIIDQIEGNKDKPEYTKPDSTAAEEAVKNAEALEEKIELPADVKTKIDELREELNGIIDEISKDDNATEAEYKDALKEVEDAANAILEKYEACEKDGHKFGAEEIATYPVYDEASDTWSQGTYTCTCSVCGYVKTVAYDRANYEAYDKAVADLNSLLADDNLTAEAKAEINKVLTDNAIRYDLMTPDQSIVDAAVAKFVAEYNKITNDETGAYEKPDYTEAEEAIQNAEALDSITDDDKAVLDGLKEDLEEIKNKENPEATAKDDQDDVDAIKDEANKIINKYSGCEAGNHTDVETDGDHNCDVCGKLDVTSHNYVNPQLTRPVYDEEKGEWSDGYYTSTCNCGDTSETTIARADYEAYDKAVADLNALLNTGKLTQTAVDMINAALVANKIAENYVATSEEQAIVDNAAAALQLTLGELTDENGLKKEYEKVDFTNYNAAVDAAKALEDVMTDEDKAAVEAEKQKVTDAGITEETSKAAGQQILDNAAAAIAAINAKYGDCADGNHNWSNPVLTTEPSEGKQGEYTETCTVCGTTQITKVDLADYSEFNSAVEALENLANTENLTTEAAKAIADALAMAEALDKNLPADATTVDGKLIEGGQDEINALVAQLQQVVANTNTAIGDGSALLPDYDAWNEAEGRYDALDKTNVKAEIITEANNLKTVIAAKEADETLTQATATQKDIDDATKRLNEIIDGITDGTLKKDADFTDVDKDLADAKEKAENNDVIDGVKEDIKEIEDKLNELRNDPTTNIEDQDEIDALEKELEDIIAGIEDGSIVKPDYTDWEAAEGAYDVLVKDNVNTDIIAEAEALKAEIAAKQADETLTQATATQKDIDEATARLNEIVAEITGVLNSKPDFNGYDGSHDDYEALVEQYGDKIKDSVADDVAALDTIVEGIRNNENATKGEYQDDIDDAKTDLDAIIAGIIDGSLRDPDYTDVEEKLNIVNGTDNLTQDVQDKIDEIEEALEEIRNKEPEANANDQPYIDILEKQLDEILDAIKDGSALVPDYTDWEAAEGEYDALDKTFVDEDIVAEAEALKAEIADKQADDTLTQATATQKDIDEATARLNEIIDGIEDGSLIKPADFTEVDKDLADAKDKANNNDVIDGVKDDIQEIEDALNDLRDTATAEDQEDINDLEDALEEIIAGIENGSLVKPDYEAWETAEGAYDALDKTNVKADIITEAEALKAEIAAKQADDTLTQATATQKDIDDATGRLNEIIAGITDGTLKKDADFTDVDKDLADAKDKANNNDVIDGVKDDIKEIEDRLNELKNDPTTNIEDQPEIDNLEKALEDIIAGIEDGSLVKPDYTDADEAIKDAEGDIDNGGKLSDEDKAAIDVLKEKLDEIKNDPASNKKDDQPAVDSIKDQIQDIIKDYAECIGGNHKYEEKVVPPTCTEGGYTEFTCTVCGKNYRGNEQPSTGHVEDTLPAREPTCSEVGLTEGKKCIVCGEILVAQKEIAKLPHVDADDDGVCDHCHYSGLYDGCACLCHNNHWFWHIVYLIFRIIWRVFKIHPVCPCGRIHY